VIRPYAALNPPPVKELSYRFQKGTTRILKESVIRTFTVDGKTAEIVSEQATTDAMQLD
jgi:Proteasome beta subunits C terminal